MKRAPIKIDEKEKRQYELKTQRPLLIAALVGKTAAQMTAAVKADLDAKQAAKPGGNSGTDALANRVAALEEQLAAAMQAIVELVERDE